MVPWNDSSFFTAMYMYNTTMQSENCEELPAGKYSQYGVHARSTHAHVYAYTAQLLNYEGGWVDIRTQLLNYEGGWVGMCT